MPNAGPRLINGLFPVSSVFELSFQIVILSLLKSVCTQFHHLFCGQTENTPQQKQTLICNTEVYGFKKRNSKENKCSLWKVSKILENCKAI
jgi:hypothetical protein